MDQILAMQRTVTTMTTTEFCMMLVMLFLTWHLWRMSERIKELELHRTALWEEYERLCKRIEDLEKDGDRNG